MSKVYVIADLHLGHRKLAEVRGFVDTKHHDDCLVERWNSVVTKRDVVYVLGDVFHLERVGELRGTKKLAMGNHDQLPAVRYAEHFTQVRACFEFDGCLLTHIPVHPGQFVRFELNVHGHMHGEQLADPRYVCVSVEQCAGGAPVLLRELIQGQRLLVARKDPK